MFWCLHHHTGWHRCRCHRLGLLGGLAAAAVALLVLGWVVCAFLARRAVALILLMITYRHDWRALWRALISEDT